MDVVGLPEIIEWISKAKIGEEKRFIVDLSHSCCASDALEIRTFEFEGSMGFEWRLSIADNHPGSWKGDSASQVIKDLQEYFG